MTNTTSKSLTLIATSALAMMALATPAFAADKMAAKMAEKSDHAMTKVAMTATTSAPSELVRFNKTLKGSVQVVEEGGRTLIRFSDDFKASNGPDLKVFLSPQGLDTVSGASATRGSLNIGSLQRNKGTQDYLVPAGVNLSQYGSVLVHCEQFSVLWGGAAI